MRWEEVRRIYPNKFVKLQVLESHIEGNKKYIDDMAVIKVIDDNREATKELVKSMNDTLVYHTGNQSIILEIKNIRAYRGIV